MEEHYQFFEGKTVSNRTNVLYVPKLAGNIFSVHAAAQNWKVISFGHKYCWILDKKNRPDGTGLTIGKLYKLRCEIQK